MKTEHSRVPKVAERSRPEIGGVLKLMPPIDIRSVGLTGILVLLVLYTLQVASSFFVPVVLAFLLSFLFAPVVRGLSRLWIPQALGAAVVLVALLGTVSFGVYRLADPARDWMAKAPETLRGIENKLRDFRKSVQEVSEASRQVDKITSLGTEDKTQKVEVKRPGVGAFVLSQTQELLVQSAIVFALLYFLLASGDLFLRKLVNLLPRLEDKKVAVEISHQIEHDVSRYLLTVAIINCVFGAAVALGLGLIGMPNPVLFGVMAGFLNFIPYIGAIVGMTAVTLVAFVTLPEMTAILLVPALYLGLNLCEDYVIMPMIVGRRLTLNPVVIFIWLVFWGWMWGVAGALMAVPLLAIFKIVCDHVEPLAPLGEFLGP